MGNIKEENSDMVGKSYQLPLNIIQFLQSKVSEGGERIQGLLNSPTISYEAIKRFKHDIENNKYQSDFSPVLKWINSVLGSDRSMIDNQKRTPMQIGMENRFRKTHDKDYNKNITPLSNMKHTSLRITEKQYKMLQENEMTEAVETECQTPKTIFHTHIHDKEITCKMSLPMDLNLDEKEAKLLEANIHNAMELVLSKYFN